MYNPWKFQINSLQIRIRMNFVSPQKFFRILDQPGLGEIVIWILKQLPMTPRCPRHRRVKTPWGPRLRGVKKCDPLKIQNGPMFRGVATPRCPMYLGSQDSLVSYVPGSRFLFLWTFKPMLQPLKQHSFKKLLYIGINYTKTVYTCLKNFPIPRFLGRLPCVPSTKESF